MALIFGLGSEVFESPRIERNKLREMSDCYKIKFNTSGYRLVFKSSMKRLFFYRCTKEKIFSL
ncbi:hypothetical protein VL10_20675 [Leclercia adecarboxylata]|nr:hypothetical protein VL10_20675 [Leclercia adecarboxylata]KMN64132.1 hypothetical protein VK95_16600 [Leclercia sp. LK8]